MEIKDKIIHLLNELKEQSSELINLGDSKEKATGYGMNIIIEQIEKIINKKE